MKTLRVVRADPAGNITLFVLTPVEKAACAAVAARLMEIEELKAEQVGFIFPNGRMEMEAGEFCGNASRAYGYLLAKQRGLTGCRTLRLSVSGCDHPIAVTVDMDHGTSAAEMPLPRFVRPVKVAGTAGTLVHLGGIAHLVVRGVSPSREFFAEAEPLFTGDPELEAYGVCFLAGERMTPLVKVPEAGTLVFEGSCGSGTLASVIAMSEGREGVFSAALQQPAGTVSASVTRQAGTIIAASIGGPVTLGEPFEVTI